MIGGCIHILFEGAHRITCTSRRVHQLIEQRVVSRPLCTEPSYTRVVDGFHLSRVEGIREIGLQIPPL